MTYNYAGIVFRLRGECTMFILLGVVCIVISCAEQKTNKRDFLVGICTIILGVALGVHYGMCILNPCVESLRAEYDSEERNSRVSPGLPFTMEYIFYDNKYHNFYLDVFSKKEIYPDEFIEGNEYVIYYDKETKIIVGVEAINQ